MIFLLIFYEAVIYRPKIQEGQPDASSSAAGLIDEEFPEEKTFAAIADADDIAAAAGYRRLKKRWHVQANKVANKDYLDYEIVWDDREADEEENPPDGRGLGNGFIDNLQPGDCVALWAGAQYPGWQTYTKRAEIELYYSI